MNEFLTPDELAELTGCKRSSDQRTWLDDARRKAAKAHPEIAEQIMAFQFRDIRPKAASETTLEHASRLLGHTEQEITQRVYRRVGEVVKPIR